MRTPSASTIVFKTTFTFLAIVLVLAWIVAVPILHANAKRFRSVSRDYTNGKKTILVFDADTDPTNKKIIQSIVANGNEVYAVEVDSNAAVVNTVVGRRVVSRQFIVGPRGCGGTENSNCVRDSIDADARKKLLQDVWYLEPGSPECIAKGGGDACMGGIRLHSDREEKKQNFDFNDFLYSRGDVFLDSDFLTYCAVRGVVKIDMVLPSLVVNSTDCPVFSGAYTPVNHDAFSGYLVNVTYAFVRIETSGSTQTRVLVRRMDYGGFKIQFAEATGTGLDDDFYVVYAESRETFPNGRPFDWRFTTNATLAINNVTSCLAFFNVDTTGVNPPTLKEPERLTDITYFLNKQFPEYFTRTECGIHVGAYDENLQLKYPGTPENVRGGGETKFVIPGTPNLPVFVEADPAWNVYEDTCERFYPFNETFRGYGLTGNDGAFYDRTLADADLCFAPFLMPELIAAGTDLKARAKQCSWFDADLATRVGDLCVRRLAHARCLTGFDDFKGKCYYKFDVIKDRAARVVAADAAKVCASLSNLVPVEPVTSADPPLVAYLERHFIYWKRAPVEGGAHCVPVAGFDANCYDLKINVQEDPTDDEAQVHTSSTQTANFWLCAYDQKYYEVPGRFDALSPRTIKVLRDGQYGVDIGSGHKFPCGCFNGYTTEDCTLRTCPFPTDTDALGQFATKYLTKGRGRCEEGDPRTALCNENFGPRATILDSKFNEAQSTPCYFRTAKSDDPTFRIENATFSRDKLLGSEEGLPCSGTTHGTGRYEPSTGEAECECTTRTRVSADAFAGEQERQFDGPECACRTPRVFSTEPVVQKLCNGKGYCCPSGQSTDDPIGSPDRCIGKPDGCYCDNGAGGGSCTCAAPADLASAATRDGTTPALQTVAGTTVVVDLKSAKSVGVVEIERRTTLLAASFTNTSDACSVSAVSTSLRSTTSGLRACAFNGERWICDGANAQFVIVTTMQETSTCVVKVMEEWFPLCGNGTNPFAGRFSAIPTNRGFLDYRERQPLEEATLGCTNR